MMCMSVKEVIAAIEVVVNRIDKITADTNDPKKVAEAACYNLLTYLCVKGYGIYKSPEETELENEQR